MRWTKGPQQSAGPCCSFLMKGGGWKGSLFIACSVPQASLCRHAAGGLHRATTLKKPILKQSQRQTLTLETGTCLLTPGSALYSPSSLGGWGGVFEPVSQPVLVTFKTDERPESLFFECKFRECCLCSFSTYTHPIIAVSLSFFHMNRKTKHCN